ncbi:LppU/SCO3897 family protein [Kitasatospora atroaurantiaca]|uniref:LppU/SCO3897 family protein n=1 Tax=Kitasatospora atroaurantiaca TaxID=285545 RepID=UPI0011A95A85|nr:toxin-antitoxin system, toxin component [Kitasatospora atroaurantiaca]
MPYGAPPAEPTIDTPVPSQPAYGEGQLSCRYCGSVPAVEANFRGHQGLIVILRYLKRQGPYCRTCGIASHRDMTSDSLWQGWWGIPSMIVNPIVMLINIPQRLKVNKLAEPLPGAPRPPMNPGKPVYLRPTILGALIPAILISLIVLVERGDPEFAKVGDCIRNNNAIVLPGVDDNNPDVEVLSCSDPKAEAKVVGREEDTIDGRTACQKYPNADGFFSYKRDSEKYTLCLQSLKPRSGSVLNPS